MLLAPPVTITTTHARDMRCLLLARVRVVDETPDDISMASGTSDILASKADSGGCALLGAYLLFQAGGSSRHDRAMTARDQEHQADPKNPFPIPATSHAVTFFLTDAVPDSQ